MRETGAAAEEIGQLEAAVESAQADLAQAVEAGDLRRDPFRFVLSALSSTLGVFPAAVRQVEKASETVRQPLSPKAETELLRRLEEAARRGAVGAGSSIARRTAILTSAYLVSAAMVGAAAGWWAGRAVVPAEVVLAERGIRMSLEAAEAWLPILLANPDPRPALARAKEFRDERTGRRASTLSLYIEPGQPAAPQQR